MRVECQILSVLFVAATAAGCGAAERPKGLYQRLQSNQESEVAQAAVEAGAAQDRQAVPYLVEALEHDAADVRLFAITSLRKITGQDFGYRPWAPSAQRQSAITRWRQWCGGRSETAISSEKAGASPDEAHLAPGE
jgi:hypothetical protein